MTVKRPLIRYHGGKWVLAEWIIEHLPPHHTYVEPFGGGASVLLRKPRVHSEVYNDLDDDVVNLFRVVRDSGLELRRAIELTPFSRTEFDAAYQATEDSIERARRLVARSFMGFASAAASGEKTGFRSSSSRSGTGPAMDWRNYPDALAGVIERLRGVVIENRNAIECINAHDRPGTLFYLDPPYPHSTRSKLVKHETPGKSYRHEMTDDQHRQLGAHLQRISGMAIVSGYPCDLYDELFAGWTRIDRNSHADGARDRVECLWLNASASNGLAQMDMFRTA